MPNSQEYRQSIVDYDREIAKWQVHVPVVTALTIAGTLTALTAFEAALAPMILGVIRRKELTVFTNTNNNAAPTDENAQRERKWLVIYHDTTTGKLYRTEIPTAAAVGHLLPASEDADLANSDVATFVTTFQNVFRSPDDATHAVLIDRIVLVGRKS